MTTSNFGLTRIRRGETMSKNGFAVLDADRVVLDDLLFALSNHSHDNAPPVPTPQDAPSLETFDSGGMLPGNTTFHYSYSFLDRWGLETGRSPEMAITTVVGGGRPEAPLLDHLTVGGTLSAGKYTYAVSYSDPSKAEETGVSPSSSLTLTQNNCQGACQITLEFDPPPGNDGPCINIYRSKPGQTRLYFLARVEGVTTFNDDGSYVEDLSITAPRSSTAGTSNRVVVTLPEPPPPDATAWRLYRTTTTGLYADSSLVHTVMETEGEQGETLVTQWEDRGDSLMTGRPRARSVSLGGGRMIDLSQLQGQLPLSAMPRGGRQWSVYGGLVARWGQTLGITPVPTEAFPTSLSAFFQEPIPAIPDARLRVRIQDEVGDHLDLWIEGGGEFFTRSFPLTSWGRIEAENSERNAGPIMSDPLASGLQMVTLATDGQFITADLGELDEGPYRGSVFLRGAGEVRIETIDGSGNPLSSQLDLSFDYLDITEVAAPDFVIPGGGGEAFMRITRLDEPPANPEVDPYESVFVDVFTYEANLPSLQPGNVAISTRLVPDTATGSISVAMTGYTASTDTEALLGDLAALPGASGAFEVVARNDAGVELTIDVLAGIDSDTLTVAEGALTASNPNDQRAVQIAIERGLARFFFQGDSEVDLRDWVGVSVADAGTDFVISFTIDPGQVPGEGDDILHVADDPYLGGGLNVSLWF